MAVPSKIYGAMAVGRPVIFVGDLSGEIARIVQEAGCGLAVRCGDVDGLSIGIKQLAQQPELRLEMGRNARAAFETHYQKTVAMRKWTGLLGGCGVVPVV